MRFIFALLILLLTGQVATAELTVPVQSGGTPTCLSRVYTEILQPANWGTDSNAATRFIQSIEGTLGVTMFFEIGPYGNFDSYSYNAKNAMWGVGVVSLNRYRNNDSIENINNHGEVAKGGFKAVIKESQAWHHETYHGEGTLLEGQRNRFYSILNGDPNNLDCSGLIGSFRLSIGFVEVYWGTSNTLPSAVQIQPSPTPRALFYASSSTIEGTQLPGVSTTHLQYAQQVGTWEVPRYPSGSYFENFFTLTDAVPANSFYNFI